MSGIHACSIRRIAALAAAAAAAATIGTGFLTSPAHAEAPGDDPFPFRNGTVRAHGGLIAHSAPSTHAPSTSAYADGAQVKIDCRVNGPEVDGNDIWYLLPGEGAMWVSARYVENDGPAPGYCNPSDGFFAGTATTALNKRSGPSTADGRVGGYADGQRVNVGCYVDASPGNRWYHTDQGRWVSADYITVSSTVRYCTMH